MEPVDRLTTLLLSNLIDDLHLRRGEGVSGARGVDGGCH